MTLMTTPPGHDVLLFDGRCRICTAAAQELDRLLGSRGTELRSFRGEGALSAFPGVTYEMCDEAIQLVQADGRVFGGMEALVQAMGRRRWGKLLSFYYIPGVRQGLDALYRVAARNRFRLAGQQCADGSCAVPFK
jgi:predicted DCC family thiol-disulfide oxidoreductase YuxK